MTQETPYEQFRAILTMNLCSIMPPDQINDVLRAVDISMERYEISNKPMDLITTDVVPEVVKIYIASMAIANKAHSTLVQYKYKLVNFFQTMNKSYMDIQTNDIRLYLYNFKAQHNASDCYMENIRGVINQFFQWLVDNEYLLRNPAAKIEKIKYIRHRRKPLASYDLEYCRWNVANVREKALVDFLFSTGCRVSECAAVKLSDINWEERSVLIPHGKGDKERTVYFNAESELSLREYLKTRDDDTDALFVTARNPHRPLSKSGMEFIFRKISQEVDIHVFPHRLRHTFATAGLRSGMPLEKLQALLGHADPKTTLIYAKQDQTDIQREHMRIFN